MNEAQRAKMKAEVAGYNTEKERIEPVTVGNNDIIHLNVGGKKMTTKRFTLCQVEGSLLATMFSGRWEDSLERDNDGCIFFDFNPQLFVSILDYLRAKKIETPSNPAPFPKVAPEQLENFDNLAAYLGLDRELVKDSFKLHSGRITIEENGAVAVHGPGQGYQYVLGKKIYHEGIVHWKLRLEYSLTGDPMFVGVVKGNTTPFDNNSYQWRGSYGFDFSNGIGQEYSDGMNTYNSHRITCKEGDTVEVVLDCIVAKLSLVMPGGQNFHLALPSSATWRLHVNLYGAHAKIRIVQVSV